MYSTVVIRPPPPEGFLRRFCVDFEFNSSLVEMVEVMEILSDYLYIAVLLISFSWLVSLVVKQ
jgi:hypothetical protein